MTGILNLTCVVSMALCLVPALANAQTANTGTDLQHNDTANIPPAVAPDGEQRPQVSRPPDSIEHTSIVSEAGVGGRVAYGRAGVVELGGNINFTSSTPLTQLTVSPTIGWFFLNDLEISAILGFSYASATAGNATSNSTVVTALAEPSIHVPFSQVLFGFVGLGVGVAYNTSAGAGFAFAPRVGVNVMVGRSGVFTPALTLVYSTNSTVETGPGGALSASNTQLGFNAGYTVMW